MGSAACPRKTSARGEAPSRHWALDFGVPISLKRWGIRESTSVQPWIPSMSQEVSPTVRLPILTDNTTVSSIQAELEAEVFPCRQ